VRRIVLVTLVLAVLTPAEAGAEVVVDAGAVRADVTESPWRLRFLDRSGREIVADRAGAGLGYRTAAGWSRATRSQGGVTISGGAWDTVLETTGGGSLSVTIARDGEGGIRVTTRVVNAAADATGMGFTARPGERFLGFGERSNAVDQRGNDVQNYVAEGAYNSDELTLITLFVPPWGLRDRPDATYFPMPWLLSTRGYGVLLDNVEESLFRLGTEAPDAWSAEAQSSRFQFRVLAGPTPADVVRRLTARVGRQPAPAAPWQLGTWFHTGQENVPPAQRERAAVRAQRAADVPVSAVETHLRYLPCGAAQVGDRRATERTRTAFFHASGLADISYLNPEVCKPYAQRWDEGAAKRVFQRTPGGEPYLFDAFVGDRTPPQTPVSQIDFSAPGAQGFWDSIAAEVSPTATTGGWRTSASTRRRTPWRRMARPARRCTTATRCSTTAPATTSRGARNARSCATSARAGQARPPTPRSCGVATRRPTGASTACAPRSATGSPWACRASASGARTSAGTSR